MGSHAGLKKVVKTVRGKKGVVKRTYWMRATEKAKAAGRGIQKGAKATGKFLGKHKGKIAAAAALTGAYLAVRGAQHVKKTHIGFQQAGRKGTAREYAKAAWIGVKGAPGKDIRRARDAASGAVASAKGSAQYKSAAAAVSKAASAVSNSRAGKAASRAGGSVASAARKAGSAVANSRPVKATSRAASSAASAMKNTAQYAGVRNGGVGNTVRNAGKAARSAAVNVAHAVKSAASTRRQTTKYSGKNRRLQLNASN